jgi:hypothetical protein
VIASLEATVPEPTDTVQVCPIGWAPTVVKPKAAR